MKRVYVGTKKSGDKGTPSFNFGDVWIEQEDGSYKSDSSPGKILSQIQINSDVSNGFLREIKDESN